MRIVLFLSVFVIGVSGCSSSNVCMYSIPAQSRFSVHAKSMPLSTKAYSFAAGTSESEIDKRTVVNDYSSNNSSKPMKATKSKHVASARKSGNLNDAMGVPGKILGGIFHGIKKANIKLPRLPRIGGYDLNKAFKTASDAATSQAGGSPL